jgi:hypothetical protein
MNGFRKGVPPRLLKVAAALALLPATGLSGEGPPLAPAVEIEEEIYRYEPANNGAGPMWCHGNTCIVRVGDAVFVSGLKTIPGARPLNNCLPLLYQRTDRGWSLLYEGNGRTREPCPLACFPRGKVFLSINPTLAKADDYGGPAKPQILEFAAAAPATVAVTQEPIWTGAPPFTEHSYRSFVADGTDEELLLLQNIGYDHAEWAFRDRAGKWSAQGVLAWPAGASYEPPRPVRLCYPAVALAHRAVHFCGVSDIEEPYPAWRAYKKELTGQNWDYDFRRLFYTWSDDITAGAFHGWIEVSSRDKTCGWIFPMDIAVRPNGDVFLLWSERAIDERLREKFFPGEKQRYSLECAVIRAGRLVSRTAIVEGGDDRGGERPGDGRFVAADPERLFVLYYVSGTDARGTALSENRVVEILPAGVPGTPVTIRLSQPLSAFFTTTPRAGCIPSRTVELLGSAGAAMRFARIRLW